MKTCDQIVKWENDIRVDYIKSASKTHALMMAMDDGYVPVDKIAMRFFVVYAAGSISCEGVKRFAHLDVNELKQQAVKTVRSAETKYEKKVCFLAVDNKEIQFAQDVIDKLRYGDAAMQIEGDGILRLVVRAATHSLDLGLGDFECFQEMKELDICVKKIVNFSFDEHVRDHWQRLVYDKQSSISFF